MGIMRHYIGILCLLGMIGLVMNCYGNTPELCIDSEDLNKDRIRCCYITYEERKGDKDSLNECTKLDFIEDEINAYKDILNEDFKDIEINCSAINHKHSLLLLLLLVFFF